MLAYQHHISQHFDSNEKSLKRSTSPIEMNPYRKDSTDYVRQIRRRSLSRSISPVRSHSPTYVKAAEYHLIKRSVSEEDLHLRMNHERRRLSMDETEHLVIKRPPVLMNYQELKAESDEKATVEQTWLSAEEPDDDAPLDLSMGSKKRRGRIDSGTESDDSIGLCDDGGRGNEGRAYKKSLMKRYCEFTNKTSVDDLILREEGSEKFFSIKHNASVGGKKSFCCSSSSAVQN